jgi:ribonuclease BN (tRNA processing enzyme)
MAWRCEKLVAVSLAQVSRLAMRMIAAASIFFALLAGQLGSAQSGSEVVMLGTGMPAADPDRSGPAVAVIVNGTAYLVDCGPGVVRRAAAAVQHDRLPALEASNLKIVFITHLHSDHTLGYPDLILSSWVLGRKEPLAAYGPLGLQDMTRHILEAWKKDIDVRTRGREKESARPEVQVHEIQPGVVYRDANVKVTAFLVKHGSWDEAFGYRFDTPDRSIVISGDTSPSDSVVKACNGCDLLLHEMYDDSMVKASDQDKAPSRKYFAAFHTSAQELAKIANEAHPKLLVLYHQMGAPVDDGRMLDALRSGGYKGPAVSAHDLDVY